MQNNEITWDFKANLVFKFDNLVETNGYISETVQNCKCKFEEEIIDYPLSESDVIPTKDGRFAIPIEFQKTLANTVSSYTLFCGHLNETLVYIFPNSKYKVN